ncbi:MAG TPA: nucleoside hydrolase [Chthoniobacterales bacterium]|nr:nucleoside hydrolase [Chthoniobacterales bacterium]
MSSQDRRPVIIDTDPGQDDAVAILFALGASDRLDVRAITAVAGNVPLSLTAKNARIVLGWANRTDIPVYAGCPRPLVREPVTAEHVHGETGLDGVPLEEPKVELANGHAVDFLIKALGNAWPASITLCLLGPMTNLAAALVQDPDIRRGIKEVVLMGGGYHVRGNVTPAAEFNVYADPEAAAVVFGSGIPLVVLPLDVTHQALSTKERIARLESLGNRGGALIAAILRSHGSIEIKQMATDGGPLHDPTVIAYLLQPSLFSGRAVNVTVETRGELTVGETVVDWRGVTGRPANALWLSQVDSDGFYELLTETVKRLP